MMQRRGHDSLFLQAHKKNCGLITTGQVLFQRNTTMTKGNPPLN